MTTFSLTPSSLAFATALSTIFCASSKEMLCFFTTSTIGHLPLDMYCALIRPPVAQSKRPFLQNHIAEIRSETSCASVQAFAAVRSEIKPLEILAAKL
jgi:hypothetical protein